MTEIETITGAQMYSEKLANGVNLLTNVTVKDENQKRQNNRAYIELRNIDYVEAVRKKIIA